MKYLVTLGDSWSKGTTEETIKSNYSKFVSEELSLEDINLSMGGASNNHIYRNFYKWVKNNPDKLDETLFLFGWTTIHRWETYDKVQNNWIKFTDGKIDNWEEMPEYTDKKWWESFIVHFLNNKNFENEAEKIYFSTKCILDKYNLKYLSFAPWSMALDLNKYFDNVIPNDISKQVGWSDSKYIISEDDYHPNVKGHKFMSDIIINKIKNTYEDIRN
ncbi:MAG: hypothetical protein CMD43_01960 [Gammaproteobacteria bacterium]|jgi:hypothetical protein|nr:hypothetical protein [Gammaproteobacteria bacterium]|tara:strand:- start:1278 stop:1928 length:651 start_codon:yes stop_codon:yes gene_type:complete